VKEIAPYATVYHYAENVPQEPKEHPDFWRIWHDLIRGFIPQGPDYVFASEVYGNKLAEVLDSTFIPVDVDRELWSISGSMLRQSPLKHWNFLPECVRPYFLKRVCLFGPESTGKSTLAKQLSSHYDTIYVHEYARPYLDPQGGKCVYEDISFIARGQAAAEKALLKQANRVLFCDTDNLTTTIWSEIYFNRCPEWIYQQADSHHYDLTLLMDIDVPWVDDNQRDLRHKRKDFFEICLKRLQKSGRDFVIISGNWEERRRKAVDAVDEMLREETSIGEF
jgi:NadR type nicotinamide-nucleotide adenylyltransferase